MKAHWLTKCVVMVFKTSMDNKPCTVNLTKVVPILGPCDITDETDRVLAATSYNLQSKP